MSRELRHPPTIALEGARLRPLRVADAAPFYAYLRDPRVTDRTSYPDVTLPLVEAIIERSLSRWAAGEPSKWGIALGADDQLVGTCGFNDWSQVHRWAELGCDLARAHWGTGLMRRAVAAALAWAFQGDQIDRVHAFARVDNAPSARLLAHSGFLREGCLRSFRMCRGRPHDFDLYALLRSDWAAARLVTGARAGDDG
ncbi:MAG: GNAT family N-acetyltransferase [Deltaproteobacteria bacterium HGW-Deltaproteobacteria-14]|jgi:ribosomal-protein-alanine N-acetyltransferase|nr:MAG: GNAT family N-acetyltransferase [Deltaproteobacteria bacterium HGW-Deltaproteobacteria-14]